MVCGTMSTDLYGIRVLALDRANRRVRLRVFVVYETRPDAFDHTPLPSDLSFFLRALGGVPQWKYRWLRAPIDAAIPEGKRYDEPWVDANAWRYIERFERVSTRNEPLLDPPDEGVTMFHYEREGCWEQESRMMQADFDVWVTRPAFLAHLELGMSWGTTAYGTAAHALQPDEASILPDFLRAKPLYPFGPRSAVYSTALSHDGAYFAAGNTSGHIVVYETDRWSEVYRYAERRGLDSLAFIAGHASLLCRNRYAVAAKSMVIDVTRRGASRAVPSDVLLDSDGRPSFSASLDGTRSVVSGPRVRVGDRVVERAKPERGWTHSTAISADGAVIAGVHNAGDSRDIVLSSALTGEVLTRLRAEREPTSLALSPDGRFLAYATNYDAAIVVRVSDGTVVRRDVRQINAFVTKAVHWDPRGRFVLSTLDPSSRRGPCHILIAPIGTARRVPRGPKAVRVVPAPSKMNPTAIASARKPALSAEAFAKLVAEHKAFLDTYGREHTFVVRRRRGVPVAYYEEDAREVDIAGLADVSLRALPSSIAGLELSCADLTAVDAAGVDATGVRLRDATVTDAVFERACLRDADLSRANFTRSNLRGADLRGADLRRCNFERCDLTGADFTGAQIGGVKLKFATLDGVVGFGVESSV